MTVPLPSNGDTSWSDWAGYVHNVATQVTEGRFTTGIMAVGTGIDPTGTTDSTTAIQALITQAAATGGQVLFPPGIYNHTGLDLTNTAGVGLVGLGGLHATGTQTRGAILRYTGTGTGSAINGRGSTGLGITSLGITHSSASFTGRLVDLRALDAVSASYWRIDRCQIGGKSAVETALCLDVDGSIEGAVTDSKFYYHTGAVSGADSASFGYAVGMTFDRCHFGRGNGWTVRNGGDGWLFTGCVFNNHTDGSGGHYAGHTGTAIPDGVSFLGCWFGDVTAGTAAQIQVNGARAFVVSGCVIGVGAGTAIQFTANGSLGVVIHGNRIEGSTGSKGIDFGATSGHSSMVLGPNSLGGIGTAIVGNPPVGSTYYDATGLNAVGGTWRNSAGQQTIGITEAGQFSVYDPAAGAVRWYIGPGAALGSGVITRVGTETAHQFEVHTSNVRRAYWTSGGSFVNTGTTILSGQLDHDGTTVGFYGATPVTKPTGVAVTAAGIHAALVSLGLIAA